MNDSEFVIAELRLLSNEKHREKMLHFGIDNRKALGVSIPSIRSLARQIGTNQELSLELWDTTIHEARILAAFIGDPRQVTTSQIDCWAREFNSWDLCDQVCNNLFVKTPFFKSKAIQYSELEPEFVKRCGFVLMACAAVHLKKEPNHTFLTFLNIIEREATDQRNFVKKAVSWGLRQIGKRNLILHQRAIIVAENILSRGDKKASWVALDALRELTSENVIGRLSR